LKLMVDIGPLAGWHHAAPGGAPAVRHARRLLDELGSAQHAQPEAGASERLVEIRDTPASAVGDWARSGAMALTCSADGTPALSPAGAASALRGALLVFRALSGLDDSLLPDVTVLGERAAIAGSVRKPGWSVGGAGRSLPAADGWWFLSLPRSTDVELVPALVGVTPVGDAWPAVETWSRDQPVRSVVDRAQLLGLAAAVIAGPHQADPLDEQAASRDSRMVVAARGAPRVGRAERPTVIDLSSLWAGPLCTSLLGLAGADVIKVESASRLDGARQGPPAFYDLLNAGHASVTLDLRSSAGVDALRELVASADVVVESARPRALKQLGIDAESAVARGIIWTSVTAYGRRGPWCDRVGFGDDVAAAAGLVATVDGIPVPVADAVADPLAGVHAAAATVAALRSGYGCLLDVSMRDTARAAALIPEEPATVSRSTDGTWVTRWQGGSAAVAQPAARRPRGNARPAGSDNDRLLTGTAAR
jgi:hypothetical protein